MNQKQWVVTWVCIIALIYLFVNGSIGIAVRDSIPILIVAVFLIFAFRDKKR